MRIIGLILFVFFIITKSNNAHALYETELNALDTEITSLRAQIKTRYNNYLATCAANKPKFIPQDIYGLVVYSINPIGKITTELP